MDHSTLCLHSFLAGLLQEFAVGQHQGFSAVGWGFGSLGMLLGGEKQGQQVAGKKLRMCGNDANSAVKWDVGLLFRSPLRHLPAHLLAPSLLTVTHFITNGFYIMRGRIIHKDCIGRSYLLDPLEAEARMFRFPLSATIT